MSSVISRFLEKKEHLTKTLADLAEEEGSPSNLTQKSQKEIMSELTQMSFQQLIIVENSISLQNQLVNSIFACI